MPIVEGTAMSTASHHKGLSNMMEQAMVTAINDCSAEGVTDPVLIRERMTAYRERARDSYLTIESEAAKLMRGLPLPSIEEIVRYSRPPESK